MVLQPATTAPISALKPTDPVPIYKDGGTGLGIERIEDRTGARLDTASQGAQQFKGNILIYLDDIALRRHGVICKG